MKRYPAYKDSGVEWLGNIPKDWDKKKLKQLSKVVLGKMLTPTDKGGYFQKPYLRAQNILWERVDTSDVKKMWFSQRELEQYRLQFDDLLVSEGGEVGRTAIWKSELEECYIQNSVHKVTFNGQLNPRYFLYLLTTFGKRGHFDAIVNRVSIGHLTKEKLQEVHIFSPPEIEQSKIARYLDHKTHLIDPLIEKKQKQIELLQEQRTALINHAVTKGLNPNIRMKDSGIEWLGDVPYHWEKKKIAYLLDMVGGSTPNKSEPKYWEGTTPWISPKDMKSFQIGTKAKDFISKKALEETTLQIIPKSTVLIVVRGMILAHTFPVGLTTLPLTINQDMKALKSSNECKSQYLARLLQGISPYILSLVEPSAHGTMCLRTDNFRNLDFYLPRLSEQDEIVEYIELTEATIDESITKQIKIIRLLREYRTTLISEVVTGKIDVRDEAIP